MFQIRGEKDIFICALMPWIPISLDIRTLMRQKWNTKSRSVSVTVSSSWQTHNIITASHTVHYIRWLMDLFSAEPLSSLLIPPAEATLHNYYAHRDLPAAAEVCKSTDYWDAAEAEETLLFSCFFRSVSLHKGQQPTHFELTQFSGVVRKGFRKARNHILI